MSLNWLLIWIVASNCVVLLVHLFRSGKPVWPRIALPLGVGGILGAAVWLAPRWAGYVGAALWLPLMLLPGLALARVNALLAQRRYAAARNLARLVAWIQPFSESRRLPQLIRAVELLHQGRVEEASPLLDHLHDETSNIGRVAILLRTKQTGDWPGFVDWVQARFPYLRKLRDPFLMEGYIQALGETGRRQEMLDVFRSEMLNRRFAFPQTIVQLAGMKMAAFCGDVALVNRLTGGGGLVEALGPEWQRFWIATALQASGRAEFANDEFESLGAARDARVSSAARRRLADPVLSAEDEPLSPDIVKTLHDLEADIDHEREFSVLNRRGNRPTRCTWLLAAILVVVFLWELPGGSENLDNLIDMGAMIVPLSAAPEPGQWWRVVNAAFLHFGPLHLGLNLLGLLTFGRRLERAWGPWLMGVTYLSCAIGSIGLAPIFMTDATEAEPVFLVGASGGVMGLVGALLAYAGIGLLHHRSRVVSREFKLLLFIVILQMIFDANTPNVSSTCHLLGLAIGIVFGTAVNLLRLTGRTERRRSVPAS